jgi:hypothetical protein
VLFEELLMLALMAVFVSSYYGYFAPPYFVGWGTLALINAGLAQGKQKSGLLWFLLSLFLGPLATLILVLLPKG